MKKITLKTKLRDYQFQYVYELLDFIRDNKLSVKKITFCNEDDEQATFKYLPDGKLW